MNIHLRAYELFQASPWVQGFDISTYMFPLQNNQSRYPNIYIYIYCIYIYTCVYIYICTSLYISFYIPWLVVHTPSIPHLFFSALGLALDLEATAVPSTSATGSVVFIFSEGRRSPTSFASAAQWRHWATRTWLGWAAKHVLMVEEITYT